MYHFIYVTRDEITGEFYIGKHSTRVLDDGYVGSGTWVKKAKRLGRKLVTEIVLFCENEQEAFLLEEKYVLDARMHPLCKNIAPGGIAPPRRFGKRSEAECKKISDSRKGIQFSQNHKDAIRANRPDVTGKNNPFFGKSHSETTRQQIRDSLAQHREQIGWKPKERKRKARVPNEIAKANRSRAQVGKRRSVETKTKMAESQKQAWEKRAPLGVISCPHCEKSGNSVVMHRWHFDHCKYKASQ